MLAVLFVARTAVALQFQTVASTVLFSWRACHRFRFPRPVDRPLHVARHRDRVAGRHARPALRRKAIVLLGLAMMAVGGVMMGVSTSFAAAAAGRVIAGTGAVFFNVLVTKMVTDWFAGREIVTAMGTLCQAGRSASAGAWLGLYAGRCGAWLRADHAPRRARRLIALALVALVYRDPPDMPMNAPAAFARPHAARMVLVLIAGLIWGLFNVAYIVLISFAPELFTQRCFSPSKASSIVSLIGWVLIPSIPLTGA